MAFGNRIRIQIGNQSYTLTTTEDEEYVRGLAEEINDQVDAMMSRGSGMSLVEALVLCAVGYCDSYKKERSNNEHLRGQLKEYLDDAAKSRIEADEARRSVQRLIKELEDLRANELRAGRK